MSGKSRLPIHLICNGRLGSLTVSRRSGGSTAAILSFRRLAFAVTTASSATAPGSTTLSLVGQGQSLQITKVESGQFDGSFQILLLFFNRFRITRLFCGGSQHAIVLTR